MLYKTLGPNKSGQDYVVADLHGCIQLLRGALVQVGFNYDTDRLFIAGDLIDRGTESLACLQLLEQPWCYAVPGNHELMLLGATGVRGTHRYSVSEFLSNGGDWVQALAPESRELLSSKLLKLVASLPFVMRVEDSILPFNLLHAEARNPWNGTVLTDIDLQTMPLASMEDELTWGRRFLSQAQTAYREPVAVIEGVRLSSSMFSTGLSVTYVGHSIVPSPVMHNSHVYLDCGAFRSKRRGRPGYLHIHNHKSFAGQLLSKRLFPKL